MSTIAATAASFEARPAVIAPVQPLHRAPSLQPNDRCPCGSGKKVKRCCGTEGTSGQSAEDSLQRAVIREPQKTLAVSSAPCSLPPDPCPLSFEGTGCAAWMRLTGLYPWKPMSLPERRESLDRLIRHARRWFTTRKASGAFRPLLSESRPHDATDSLDVQLRETLRDAVTISEPSFELAQELEISEAKLNQLCRERSGLSAREWWDAVRAEDTLKAIRAEIEAALDGAVLDRTNQIRKRGVQLEDLHRALRQHRRSKCSSATERAYNLGFRTPARLNWALWVATRKTMQQHEAEILKEIFRTWSYDHHSCRLIAKNTEAEFKPKHEDLKPNYPPNPPINKEATVPGLNSAPMPDPVPAHEHAA